MSHTSYTVLTRDQIAERAAQDIPDGAYVNLGIGLPTKIAQYLPDDKDVFLHSENGLLAFGPPPAKGEEDPELINAGKEYVTMLDGGSFFHHGDSFAMMRGGDLANWSTGATDAIPAVGGAMDLAVGAKKVFVMTNHTTKTGDPKIVSKLTYPVTGKNCVDRIYTDLCVIDVTDKGLAVTEMVDGLSFADLQALTGATLIDATNSK